MSKTSVFYQISNIIISNSYQDHSEGR